MEAGAVVCGAICPYRTENEVGQPWVQRSFMTADFAKKIGWRLVIYLSPQGTQVVWACPECALELGVIAKLEGGYRSALTILDNHGGVMSTRTFSETRWPERPTIGRGWNMGITYLMGRLAKRRLVDRMYGPKRDKDGGRVVGQQFIGYKISRAGQQALKYARYDVPLNLIKSKHLAKSRWEPSIEEKEPDQGHPRFKMVYA
jgi:hypothetical protein